MVIKEGEVRFGRAKGSGPRTKTRVVEFASTVLSASAMLRGFRVGFSPSAGDHPLGRVQVRLSTTIEERKVHVHVTYGLRDWSGEWDDDYQGTVWFTVVAECAPRFALGDLAWRVPV